MKMTNYLCIAICITTSLFVGCTANNYAKPVDRICSSKANVPKTMAVAEEVLTKMYFVIEKADIDQAVIRTRPLAAAQAFEFWRRDTIGKNARLKANLQSLQRIVEMTFTEQAGRVCIDCTVWLQKLSLPERDLTITSAGSSIFDEDITGTSVQKGDRIYRPGWIDLGEDKKLATRILRRIEKQLAKNR